jgi:hypothetical protein
MWEMNSNGASGTVQATYTYNAFIIWHVGTNTTIFIHNFNIAKGLKILYMEEQPLII